MYIYANLRIEREAHSLKQEEVANILKITQQQYQLYESGKREMPMHLFIALAKFYGVTLDELVGMEDFL